MASRTPRKPRKPRPDIACMHCKAEHPEEHVQRVVYNRCDLHGPWAGWRMSGRNLVSPEGLRFTPQRVLGLAWREAREHMLNSLRTARERKARQQEVVKVVVVNLADWQQRHLGSRAG